MPAASSKTGVARELRDIADGRSSRESTTLEEFLGCPDWQLAVAVLSRAVSEDARWTQCDGVSTPPCWMPPVL